MASTGTSNLKSNVSPMYLHRHSPIPLTIAFSTKLSQFDSTMTFVKMMWCGVLFPPLRACKAQRKFQEISVALNHRLRPLYLNEIQLCKKKYIYIYFY